MRIALGCMRLSTDPDADDERARRVLAAALASGITTFDTAHAYGSNERVVGEALVGADVTIVTKCGMRREGTSFVPDGRASAILDDAAASREALGRAPDLLLLHAPDPRVPLATSVRALAKARDEGLARAIGLSNVGRKDLIALEAESIAAVQVALGAFDDAAARGGLVEACAARGIAVQAYAPLGGPKRAAKLARDPVLTTVAARLDATAAEVVLAYMCSLHPSIVPVVGARTAATAQSLARAAALALDDEARRTLDARFPGLAVLRGRATPRGAPVRPSGREVVIVMGLPGAGKSELAASFVERGYQRLNRDTLGGTLKGIVARLEATLANGEGHVVLDNTYVTRALRSDVVRAAAAHGASVRCIFVDTPPDDARINVIQRILARHGRLLEPDEAKRLAKTDPTALAPSAVNRMLRDLERPEDDEGFASIDVRPFVRRPVAGGRAAVAVPLEALARVEGDTLVPRAALPALPADALVLVFGWWPCLRDDAPRVVAEAERFVRAQLPTAEVALCTHPAGPPICWCRPPLPGSWLAFAHRHGVDPAKSACLATSAAHRSMARMLGLAAL